MNSNLESQKCSAQTRVFHGYDVYLEKSFETLEFFVSTLEEAQHIAQQAIEQNLNNGERVVISKCKEYASCISGSDDWVTEEYVSYCPVKVLG